MMRSGSILLVLALLLLGSSCIRRPKGVMSDDATAKVIADMELADAYLQNHPQGADAAERRERMVAYILDKHGVSEEDFDSTMAWYGRNADEYVVMMEKVKPRLAKARKRLAGAESIEHLSADLWPYSRMAMISPLANSDALTFSIPSVEVERGQRLELKLRLRNPSEIQALLGVEYEDGTSGYMHSTVTNRKNLRLTLQTDTGRMVRRIFGSLMSPDASSLPIWMDSIALHALPYDSMEYSTISSQRVYKTPSRRMPRKPLSVADSLRNDSLANAAKQAALEVAKENQKERKANFMKNKR